MRIIRGFANCSIEIALFALREGRLLSGMEQIKAGNKQTYTVTTQTPNTTIADTNFEFNAANYPGVEIIDLTVKKKK